MDIILELQCEGIKIESYGDLGLRYEAFFPGKSLDIPKGLNISSLKEEEKH